MWPSREPPRGTGWSQRALGQVERETGEAVSVGT